MTVFVNIPKLGFSMTEGTLVSWLVPDGASVTAGSPIYVIATDKVENEVEAPSPGVIRLIGSEGETYPVGTPIAEIT